MQSRLNRGICTLVAWAAATGLIVLAGCAGALPADNAASPALTATPGIPVLPAATAAASTASPTSVPLVGNTPAPEPASSTPIATVEPATASATVEPATPAAGTEPPPTGQSPTITLDNNGQTITMHPGERLVMQLGLDLVWTVTSSDPAVISRVVNILAVRGSQGVYEAHAAGRATLAATGDAACRTATPPCMVPSRLFQIQVIVQ